MIIYDGVDNFPQLKFPVVTSGTFDGVHKGHQKILARITEIARSQGGETVLVTYWPHPRLILFPDNPPIKLLSTFEEKAALLEKNGIDHLVKITFTKDFSNISSNQFVTQYLVNTLQTKKLVIGYDHKFGKNGEGSFEYLIENKEHFGFEVEEIPKQDLDHIVISSTIIRKALIDGNVSYANKYLGRKYEINGKVIKGNQVGRSIGFPTANLEIDDNLKLIPADGVYAVNVIYQNSYWKGMMNIGFRPTIDGSKKVVEVHIFDFNKTIYTENLKVEFVDQIRKEEKFNNKEELAQQLNIDKKEALRLLS